MITVLALALAVSSQAAEEIRQPRPKIELGDVTLRDGRVLQGARLLGSGSARKLNIAHMGGIEQVPFDSFSPEFLEAHKEIIGEVREEYLGEAEIRQKALADIRRAENKKKADIRVAMIQAADRERQAMERSRKDIAEAEKQLKKREEAEARRAALRAAELARSRDGLLLESFYRESDGIWLTVRNVHENPRRLDWRELRARLADGRIVTPINCLSPDVNDRSWDIRSGEKRSFIVRWYGGDEIEAVTWADGGQEIAWKSAPEAAPEATTQGQ